MRRKHPEDSKLIYWDHDRILGERHITADGRLAEIIGIGNANTWSSLILRFDDGEIKKNGLGELIVG